ncbi:MAG: Adenylate cyclase [uncultured bacterium (gcode 4)]|uniref:Adenylate cyclase n=1 Tax=uncultured bacterium (gcode 4) TaxID=1234023 RepID=K1XIG5_9BACT|nr:MAG: Adenylate cyclase [uncultured bacterium (gcode 4)]
MGINKWVAVVGNIGSMGKKIEYTALGDSVNTASRFEGINKLYGTLICVGESVMEEAKEHFVFRKLDSIQVKWKEKPVFIYELIGEIGEISSEKQEIIREFEKALSLYVMGNIAQWEKIFKKLSEQFSDAPSLTFVERCEKLIEDGVPEGWQWVYRATEK